MTSGIRRIRVLIVDDHEMVRGGLAAFLHSADDLELAGEAETGEEAVQLARDRAARRIIQEQRHVRRKAELQFELVQRVHHILNVF